MQRKKDQGQEIKEEIRRRRGSLFPLCYLEAFLCFVFNLSSFFCYFPPLPHFSPSIPPYLPTSTPSSWSLVPGPSVTLTSTTAGWPAVFGPPAFLLYFCLFHTVCMCVTEHYGLHISTQAWARAHFVYWSTASHAFFFFLCVSQSPGPPSWRQLIYNLTRQRKFALRKLTQTGRCTRPADMTGGCKYK